MKRVLHSAILYGLQCTLNIVPHTDQGFRHMKTRDERSQIIKHNEFITTNVILFVWH